MFSEDSYSNLSLESVELIDMCTRMGKSIYSSNENSSKLVNNPIITMNLKATKVPSDILTLLVASSKKQKTDEIYVLEIKLYLLPLNTGLPNE